MVKEIHVHICKKYIYCPTISFILDPVQDLLIQFQATQQVISQPPQPSETAIPDRQLTPTAISLPPLDTTSPDGDTCIPRSMDIFPSGEYVYMQDTTCTYDVYGLNMKLATVLIILDPLEDLLTQHQATQQVIL